MIRQFQQKPQRDNDDDDNDADHPNGGELEQPEISNMRLLRVLNDDEKRQQRQKGQQDGHDDDDDDDEDKAVLEDTDTLTTARILDNEILHLVFCINEDEDEYEPVEVVPTELPHQRGGSGVGTSSGD